MSEREYAVNITNARVRRCPRCWQDAVNDQCPACGWTLIKGPQVFSPSETWASSRRAVVNASGSIRRFFGFAFYLRKHFGMSLGPLRVTLMWRSKPHEGGRHPGDEVPLRRQGITLATLREHYGTNRPPRTTLAFRLKAKRALTFWRKR